MPDRVAVPRDLVVTVGTSLFSSASWNCEGPFSGLLNYRGWLEDRRLERPSRRRGRGWRTVEKVEELLRERAPEELISCFAWAPERPLRYSGELTTLVRLQEREGGGEFVDWLRQSYPRIHLICASDEEDGGRVAAGHLRAILRGPLGHPDVRLEEVLVRKDLDRRLENLGSFLQELAIEQRTERADLIVTGGYKAYAVLAGRWVATQPRGYDWRAVYLHEDEAGRLIREGVDQSGLPTVRVDDHSVPQPGWPRLGDSER